MAGSKGTADRFQPVKGWVTESNLANYEQDVAVDIENMDIDSTGLTERRFGFDAEAAEGLSPVALFDDMLADDRKQGAISFTEWREVSGAFDINMLVVQAGYKVHIYEDTTPLDVTSKLYTVDLSAAGIKVGNLVDGPVHVSIGIGFAIVTHRRINPVLITLDEVDVEGVPVLSHRALNLQIRTRDLLGEYDVTPDREGATLSAEREWDLRNSGWPLSCVVHKDVEGSGLLKKDPIVYFEATQKFWPSPHSLFNAMTQASASSPAALGAFSPWEWRKLNFGKTAPPCGRFTHSAYSFDSRQILIDNLHTVSDDTPTGIIRDSVDPLADEPLTSGTVTWSIMDRPRCSGYHNGHVYFADTDRYGKTRILVSQLIKDLDNIEKCYQDADPTAEEINDLIATDGYTMFPVGMGAVLNMVEFNKRLLLLCSNGVWAIKGTDGGATATDFTIDKIASVEFFSAGSVVDSGTAVMLWTDRGIIAIGTNDYGDLVANNLTEKTIDDYYETLSRSTIKNVKGTFVTDLRRVYWTIPSEPDAFGEYVSDSSLVLVLNMDTGGFYKYTITGGPKILAPIHKSSTTTVTVDDPVTKFDETVITDSLDDPLTVKRSYSRTERSSIAFLAAVSDTEAYVVAPTNQSFLDWFNINTVEAVDAAGFVDFAYIYPQSMVGSVQSPYIHTFMLNSRSYIGNPVVAPLEEYHRVSQVYVQVLEQL